MKKEKETREILSSSEPENFIEVFLQEIEKRKEDPKTNFTGTRT